MTSSHFACQQVEWLVIFNSSWRKDFMGYEGRVNKFRQQMAAASEDIAFLPISAGLQYLTGIPRDMPNFGAVIYPGRWLEGAFIPQTAGPIITLPRRTPENHYGGATT